MAITPIPSTRVSDVLVRQRLLNQLAGDQADLVRLQTQVSTGRRIFLPSEDAPAALRAISLQQLLQRKAQVKTNLETNQSFLSATDSALSNTSSLLASVRATALGVSDSTTSDSQRQTAAQEVGRILQQLIDTGNQKFRGRYLFAGSRTTEQPFTTKNGRVQYNGNEKDLISYSDIDLLFNTNADGESVFGAISQPVLGSSDLNPILKPTTRLSELNGGQGVSRGSIEISDGVNTRIVDISGAATIGDVAALLESQPPDSRKVSVSITPTGLNVSLDSGGGGNLTIREVGSGTTARDLGILHKTGIGPGPVLGNDLNPQLNRTTALADVLGSRAKTTIRFPDVNNDVTIEAKTRGAAYNNVTVSFVDNPGITKGSETVTYDTSNPANVKLIFQVDAGNTTANDIVNALNNDPVTGQLFGATIEGSDNDKPLLSGNGLVDTGTTGVTSQGSGIEFDQSSGLQIISGGTTHVIDLSAAKTVEDLLNAVNGADAGALAELNATGTGINIRSRLSGVDFTIGENGGQTASQLGLRSFNASTRLSDLNYGVGVHSVPGSDFIIRRKDGVELSIDVSSASTIGDVINLINNDPNNQVAANKVTAQLSKFGNGIELVNDDPSNTATLQVIKSNFSQAAEDLGLIPVGASVSAAPVTSGTVQTLTGRDVNPNEVHGVFNSLIRLQQALNEGDLTGIRRAINLLDDDSLQLNLARGELGARQQGLDALQNRLDDEVISLQDSLSKDIDVDPAKAISELTARQATLQATLQTMGLTSKLTLLDFL